ncbi:hypothetical protein GCM10023144_12670 [Pigmentiphaga soli]|uniref:Flagella basal body P-ring formation protein FlgA n=1 Tax=Pigmentiphaga soli TaxID=1007095 RepID=A0ABP8GPC1_9BURK
MKRLAAAAMPWICALCISAATAAASFAVAAPVAGAASAADAALESARQALAEHAGPAAQAAGARIEVRFPAAARARAGLAPCAPQAFIVPGARPWGRTTVGLRCTDRRWQARIPAQVSAYAKIPVLLRPLAAGTAVQDSDWALAEVDLADWPRGAVADAGQLAGARVSRPLRTGEPVPPDALVAPGRLDAGDSVQVILVGRGFTVKATGKALNAANPGQSARVQLDSGRTVAGTLRNDHEIEVGL